MFPDALSRRADLFFIDKLPDDMRESDWPLIALYVLGGREVPTGILSSLVKGARDSAKYFDYDAGATTLVYLGQPGLLEHSPFISSPHWFALLQKLHDNMGHQGRDSVLELLRGPGWWPRQYEDVKNYIGTCASCQINKQLHDKQETGVQVPLPVVGPFE